MSKIKSKHPRRNDSSFNCDKDNQNHSRNEIICTICKEPITGPENISVTTLGHIFHYLCATEYAKERSKNIHTSSESWCENALTLDMIVKINSTVEDKDTDDQSYFRYQKGSQEDATLKNIMKLILEKFNNNPNKSISDKEGHELMKEIEKIKIMQKCKSVSENKPSPGQEFFSKVFQSHCNNCVNKKSTVRNLGFHIDGALTWETHIDELCGKLSRSCFALRRLASTATRNVVRSCYFATVHSNITYGLELWGRAADRNRAFVMQKREIKNLSLRIKQIKVQKTRYYQEKKNLKEQLKITKDDNQAKAEDAKTTIKELMENKEALEEKIQHLQSEVHKLVSELNTEREKKEALQLEVQTLQSQGITAREDQICNDALLAEIQELKTRTEQMETEANKMSSELNNERENKEVLQREVQILKNEVHKLVSELNTERKNKEALQREVQTLQSEVITARKDDISKTLSAEELRTRIEQVETEVHKLVSELNTEKKNKEALQQEIQTLQSQVVPAREVIIQNEVLQGEIQDLKTLNEELTAQNEQMNIQVTTAHEAIIRNEALQTEVHNYKTRNEELMVENDQMERDLATLKADFASQDSTITDFMIHNLEMNLNNDALLENLYKEIDTLKQTNISLKSRFEELLLEINC